MRKACILPFVEGDLKPGDVVALRREYRTAKEEDVSCVRLLDAGLPNEFSVLRLAETKDGHPALVLSPCCDRLKGDDGALLCGGHPPQLFELVHRGAPDLSAFDALVSRLFKGDPKQYLGVEVPILGSLLHFAHFDDGEREGVMLRIAGLKPILVAGKDLEAMYGVLRGIRSLAKGDGK